MIAMSTSHQDKVIWVPGRFGILVVLHKHLFWLVNSSLFNMFMNFCVLGNTVVLGCENLFFGPTWDTVSKNLNTTFTIVFAIEMGLKIIGLTPKGYLNEKMNIFDGGVVTMSIFELAFLSNSGSSVSALRGVRILRVFRVLRVTRLLRALAFMQIIINVISKSLSDFIYILLLLVLFIFIYALLGMQIYGGKFTFGNNSPTRRNFDDFKFSFLAIFHVLTVENWPEVLYAVMLTNVGAVIGILFLISWIFIGNMVFLNLFLTILLEGFTNEEEEAPNPLEDAIEEPEINFFIKDSLNVFEREKKYENFNLKTALTENITEFDNLLVDEKSKNRAVDPFAGIECEESLFIFPKNNFRRFFAKILKHPNFESLILFMIILTSIKLAIDTYLDPNDVFTQKVSDNIDMGFTLFFASEAALKIIVYGLAFDKGSYLKETWNQLDCFIVITSLVDLMLANVDIPIVKILRLLRTLRPLRFISHNINLKIIVTALLESFSGIINVTIVIFLIWVMYGILGVFLMENNFFFCSIPDIQPYGISKAQCVTFDSNSLNASRPTYSPNFNGTHYNGNWIQNEPNFSNLFQAFLTLFDLSTQEGWTDIMNLCTDFNGDDGPSQNVNLWLAYYVISFIMIGTNFLVNLFVGVILFNFTKAQSSEQKSLFLTPDQQHWIEILKRIPKAKTDFFQIKMPTQKLRLLLYRLLNHPIFDTFIMCCIVVNILTMAMDYEDSPATYNLVLDNLNYFFTAVFITEAIFKIIAYRFRGYWYNSWNRFDAFVVLTSIIDIMMSQAGQGFLSFMKSGTQLARIFRVLRVTRLLKLIKSLEGLQQILETLLMCLSSLFNVGALLFLVYFIYAVLGVFLFKDITTGKRIGADANFANFGNAMIILFRCSTGEDWYLIMFDCFNLSSKCVPGQTCGNMFAPLYFLTFITATTFIMLNLFILIIIEQFEERANSKTDMIADYKEYLISFRKIWSVYSTASKGVKVHQKYLIEIFKCFKPPFGFELEKPRSEIAKEIMLMNVSG